MNLIKMFKKKESNRQQTTSTQKQAKLTEPLEMKATKANKVFAENTANLAQENYLTAYRNADVVFSCVSYAADIASQVDIKVMANKNGQLVPYKNEKVVSWFVQPNPFQSMSDIIYIYMQSYLLTGNAYLTFEKVGTKYEGWVLNPVRTEIVPHPKKYIEGFIYDKQIPYKTDEILFFKNSTLNSEYYGESYLAGLVDPLAIEAFAIDDLKSFYEHSLIAQGIFSSEFPLSQEQIDSLREQFRALYGQGGSERHGHIIVPSNMKYQPLRINPKDGMLLEALGISEERIYKVFRLNPALLGIAKDSVNGTELKEFKKLYVNNFLRPILNRMIKQWETFFRRVLKDNNLVLVADYSGIPEISDALTEKIDQIKSAFSSGFMSINEARDYLNLPKVEGQLVDDRFIPSFLFGSSPMSVTTGQPVELAPPNQQPKPRGSNTPEGGQQDGTSR